MTSQISLPANVRPDEVERQKSLGDAIALCANVAGFSLDKELQLLRREIGRASCRERV